MTRTINTTTLILLACAACAPPDTSSGPPPSEPSDVGVVTAETAGRALFGALTVRGQCDQSLLFPRPPADAAALEQKIIDAVTFAQNVVATRAFAECVRESQPIDAIGWSAEHIVDRSTTPNSVTVTCADSSAVGCSSDDDYGWLGCGSINSGREDFMLDTNFVRTSTVGDIADTLVHEILHNWGAVHPSGPVVSHSVPRVAGRCISQGRPEGAKRSEIPGDVALSPLGGGFGIESFIGGCYEDEYGTGLEVVHNGSGVTELSLLCSEERQGQLSGLRLTGGAVPGAGYRQRLVCAPGAVLVGVTGSHGWPAVRSIQGICVPLANLRSNGFDFSRTTARVGSVRDWAFRRRCPAGKAVMGLRQRSGNTYPGHIELVCDDVLAPSGPLVNHLIAAGQPSSASPRRFEDCEGHQFLEGLFGHTTSGVRLRRVGGVCATVMGSRADERWSTRTDVVGGAPASSDDAFLYKCAPGQVVVGYRLWTDGWRARGVAPLCASAGVWRRRAEGWRVPGGVPSSFPGVSDDRLCPVGKAALGLYGRSSGVVDELHLRCGRLPGAAQTVGWSAVVGGSGGSEFELACPDGGPITGLAPAGPSGPLLGLSVTCGIAHGDEVRTRERHVPPPVGGGADLVRPLTCAAGRVLVGVTGTSDRVIQSAGMVCQDIREVRRASSSNRSTHPSAGGPSVGSPFTLQCPLGQVVTSLAGRAGARVDSLRLFCAAPDLAVGTAAANLVGDRLFRLPLLLDSPQRLNFSLIGRGASTSYDLFIRRGAVPTATDYDARATSVFSFLRATLPGPVDNGVYWVRMVPRSASNMPPARLLVQ